MKKNIKKIVLLSLYFMVLYGQNSIAQSKPNSTAKILQFHTNLNVIEILEKIFPIFYGYIKKTGYAAPIENAKNITIFAPTDEAFLYLKNELLGEDTYDSIFNVLDERGIQKLKNILNLHIIPGRVLAAELMHLDFIQPFAGRKLPIHVINGQMKINDSATAISSDIIGTNGVIHAINAVIM